MSCTSRNMTSLPYQYLGPVDTVFFDGNNFQSLSAPILHFALVRTLFLNNSNISDIKPHAFKHLSRIETIYLQDNNIHEVGALVFSNLTTLQRLYLQNNKIHHIYSGSFEFLNSLKWIVLHGNNLTSMDLLLFDNLSNLSKLTLHGNPWDCSCGFGSVFKKWLLKHTNFGLDINNIYCGVEHGDNLKTSNKSGNSKLIVEIDSSVCNKDPTIAVSTIIAVSAMSIACILISAIVITCYANRLLLMVWAYNKYGLRSKHKAMIMRRSLMMCS